MELVLLHGLKLLEALDGAADGLVVGEHAPQPPVVDVEHAAALGLFGNGVLGLLLGAHEQDDAAVGHRVHHVVVGDFKELDGLLQVDDVDAVSGPEDVRPHLGVPAAGLVAEVHPGLQQFLHGDIRHGYCLLVGPPRRRRRGHRPISGRHQPALNRRVRIFQIYYL